MSRLVVLHEEAEDGNTMPDLAQPVAVVKMSVDNLVKVTTLLSFSLKIVSRWSTDDWYVWKAKTVFINRGRL